MKPLLKWAGGKRHIANELIAAFPKEFKENTYYEPFIGGAAIFLEIHPPKSVISDINLRLISFYENIKSNQFVVMDGVKKYAEIFNQSNNKKETFLAFRTKFNESDPISVDSAILFYVLNKLCFNGLYRENSKGHFNVPFGQKREFPKIDESDFKNLSLYLENTTIYNMDFRNAVKESKAGDFVYFDPPYVPLTNTASFTAYSAKGFGQEEQESLARLMVELKEKNVKAVCSNSDTEITRSIYKDLIIKTIEAPRFVSAKASGRGIVTELVISNFDE